MATLAASDYRRVLDFLEVAHTNDGPDPFPEHVLEALRRVIPCSIATYREWDATSGLRFWASGVDTASAADVWDRYTSLRFQDPLPGVPTRPGPGGNLKLGAALKLSDFLTLRELRQLELHAEICRPLGIDYVMKVFLPAEEGGAGLVLDNERRDFSERDRDVLDALAPHLALLRSRHEARQELVGGGGAMDVLSSREREVLRLVAHGLTNPEIAATLVIAPGTVRKHLDNIFAKLGVHSRAHAVAVASGNPRRRSDDGPVELTGQPSNFSTHPRQPLGHA